METIKTYKLQFYADNVNYNNKMFSFDIKYRPEIFNILYAFAKNKNKFRAIFLKTTEQIGTYKLESSKELIFEYNFFKEVFNINEVDKNLQYNLYKSQNELYSH